MKKRALFLGGDGSQYLVGTSVYINMEACFRRDDTWMEKMEEPFQGRRGDREDEGTFLVAVMDSRFHENDSRG
ncbi:hypothetical protein ACFL6Y_03550 [Elusimicrobiota bacterium]